MSAVDDTVPAEIWEDPDSIADIRRGDVLAVMDQGRRVTGVAHHTTNGAWFTAEGGLLLRPGLAFVWLERHVEYDALYTVIRATLDGVHGVTLIRMPDGWWQITGCPQYRRVWAEGDAPLNVLDVEIVRSGVMP